MDFETTLIAMISAYIVVMIVLLTLIIVVTWKIFVKAGEDGWKCLIPFYNGYIMFKIATGNGWLYFLMFIPVVNLVMAVIFMFDLASVFGYSTAFGFGLLLLPPVFYCILAFGDNEYVGNLVYDNI